MNELTGIFALVAFIVIAAIIMPLVVIGISSRVLKIQKTLAAMEHMMRHGK